MVMPWLGHILSVGSRSRLVVVNAGLLGRGSRFLRKTNTSISDLQNIQSILQMLSCTLKHFQIQINSINKQNGYCLKIVNICHPHATDKSFESFDECPRKEITVCDVGRSSCPMNYTSMASPPVWECLPVDEKGTNWAQTNKGSFSLCY